jgi:hydrogenase small subunit
MEGQNCSGCQTSLLNRVVDCGGTGYYDADLINALYATGVAQGTPSDPQGLYLNVVNDVGDLLVGDGVRALTPLTSRALSWADDLGGVGVLPSPNNFPNGFITLEGLHTVTAAAGDLILSHIQPIVNAGGFVLLFDGSIPDTNEEFCFAFDNVVNDGLGTGAKIESSIPTDGSHGDSVTIADALRWMLPKAAFAVSVGTCAAYGGIPAGKRNKTGAMGLADWAAKEGIGTTVVNVPGCPPHPDWIVFPVAYFLVHAALCALDSKGRPAAIYGDGSAFCTTCANQPTQGTPSAAQALGDDNCQVKNGCKGPYTFGDCPTRQKNVYDDGTVNNWCAAGSLGPNIGQARYVCHGCIEPDFPDWASLAQDANHPRTEKNIKGFFNSHADANGDPA